MAQTCSVPSSSTDLPPEIREGIDQLSACFMDKCGESPSFEGKTIIFLIGGPGCGKGTQSKKIIETYDTGYMSAGDLLRKEAANATPLGNYIHEQMKLGAILPQEITIGLLKREILRQQKELYLIDGFPRQTDQAQIFEEQVCPCAISILIDVPDEILIERLLRRGQNSGRCDDNPDCIRKRIVTFHNISELVHNHFSAYNKAIKIDGNREPDAVFEDVKAVLDRILTKEQ